MTSVNGKFSYDGLVEPEELDWRVCSRARLARDARFDGKFFIAVLSTKIYCRPICRARVSGESSVRYFRTAAAAEEAGFRPCLRCRPECSPGAPVWAGTQNTVARALRLISENGLENGVEALAERVGIGARHLRRLFLRHLGATPSGVAHTNRLHFAKKLIDETQLPMTQVAIAAGFGSVRRFNATIGKTYKRTPTQIRRLAHQAKGHAEDHYTFQLHFRAPYDWRTMLRFLGACATPGVEAVEEDSYRRSISLDGKAGYFEVRLDEQKKALIAEIQFDDALRLFTIVERIRAMFDVDADWDVVARTLRNDSVLAQLVEKCPGRRVAGCWDGFELTTCAILRQHATGKEARALADRLVHAFGQQFAEAGLTRTFPSAAILSDANLRVIGLNQVQASTIRAFARAVCEGRICFQGALDSETMLNRLREIHGIEEAELQYIAMRALREPDAFPSKDQAFLGAANFGSEKELERRSAAWRPWRAYAAMYLWNGMDFQEKLTAHALVGNGRARGHSAEANHSRRAVRRMTRSSHLLPHAS